MIGLDLKYRRRTAPKWRNIAWVSAGEWTKDRVPTRGSFPQCILFKCPGLRIPHLFGTLPYLYLPELLTAIDSSQLTTYPAAL